MNLSENPTLNPAEILPHVHVELRNHPYPMKGTSVCGSVLFGSLL